MSWQRIKALREERAQILGEMKGILDVATTEKREITAAEVVKFDDLEKRAASKVQDIERVEKMQELQASLPGRHNVDPGSGSGSSEWRDANGRPVRVLTNLEQRVSDEFSGGEQLSAGRGIRGLLTGNWNGAEAERRALSTGPSSGGYLFTGALGAGIIDKARAQSICLRAGAQTVTWTNSNTMKIARLVTDPVMEVKAENAAFTGSTPAFDAVTLTAFTIGTIVDMARELAEDAPNSPEAVENALAAALAVQLDYLALFGVGTTEPTGLKNYSGVQSVAVGGLLTDYSDFISARTKILTANGQPNGYVVAPRDDGALESLLTGGDVQQYLVPPKSIAALPRYITSSIPVNGGVSTDESTAFMGDFTKMLIGIRQDALIEVSTQADEAFDKHQLRLKITWRGDVALLQPSHFVKLTGIRSVVS